MTKVSAPGSKDLDFSKDDVDLGILEKAKVSVDALGKLRIDESRSLSDPADVDKAGSDTIVELVLEGDLRWITTVERLKDDFPGQVSRSASVDGDDDLLLPTHLGRAALRGGGSDGLKVVSASVFDIEIDIDQIVKEFRDGLADKAGEFVGDITGPAIAKWVDKKLVEKPGVYRLNAEGQKAGFLEEGKTVEPTDKPYLLFLHGTISTTDGSFGGLWNENSEIWRNIVEHYQDRMLTLEHHTLAESPIHNALTALDKLPPKTKLHIVSHSRGGMIGELLARSGRNTGANDDALFDENDFNQFGDAEYRKQHDELEDFNTKLIEKSISVERYVRVACPAAGTTLASGRLDRWLSALMNVVGKLGLDTFALYRFVRGFTLAVVETRTEPENIPGLEAMMPGSPLTKILNRPDIETEADLSAIAGDIEGQGIAHRFGVWLTDRFFQGDHDLVVDTASMFGGQHRPDGKARSYFEFGPEVYHFRYFKNLTTAEKVWDGLRREDDEQALGFAPLPSPPALEDLRSRSGEPRPGVFILPGILGSELGYGDNRIWMDLKDIFRGRIERLDLHRDNPKDIKPFRMFPRYYNELANYLAASHDVLPFPYDWRISMQSEAARFAADLADRLDGSSQPVRILAHSMGGLVARLAFAQNPDLWQKFRDKDGSRFVMLGTPNRGSFSIPRMLMGKERTTALLALLDIKNDEKDLLNFIRRFPGILELLPADSHHDFFDERVWNEMDRVDGRGWQEPISTDLDIARETWRRLKNAPVDNAKMVYVAGQAESTPVDMQIDGSRVRFQATAQGDGRVPWATGIPEGLPTFYVSAAHGDLPRHEQAFGGYLDLLQQGTTRLLSNQQPVLRGAAMPFELPDERAPIYPDQETLEATALGGHVRYGAPSAKVRPVTISIRHGDLAFSPSPVMVGHYHQDSLNGAERHLDTRLDQRLSKRHKRGLYPGRIDTTEVVIEDRAFPPGAVVIGLGAVGNLVIGKLKRALVHGLRRYCLTMEEKKERERCDAECDAMSRNGSAGVPGKSFGLSTLLIGSGDDGLRMEEAMAALLDAVLDLQRDGQLSGLERIEIIERSEHRAIAAMQALTILHKQPRYEGHLEIDLDLKLGKGGVRKLVLEQDQDWSQRIEIKKLSASGHRYPGLQFAALTGRARIEDSVVAGTLKLADAFIEAAIEQSRFGGKTSPGRTLFELLLPLRLKFASGDDRNLVLMLDHFAAGYPWELLEDDQSRPPAIRAGVIRQLHDERFRADVVTTSLHSALVVGDPDPVRPHPQFPALDGAVTEARTIAKHIARAGYAVDEEIRTRPTSAVAALMSGEYRIVHLAGHGVFNEVIEDRPSDLDDNDDDGERKNRPETGMVMGDGLYLTPGAVNQLSHVPELVFLNCCHLGRVNARAERSSATRFNELAANLATQFIKIGCKAVIAAGWAVDDAAANTFASTFYREMLDNRAKFMEAVRRAREQTFMAHPGTNTWGAYQAYGDPSFTLNGKKAGGSHEPAQWFHPYEAELAFRTLAQHAETAVRSDFSDLQRRYERCWVSTLPDWRKQSDILAAKARAAGALGLFKDAIDAYGLAITCERPDAPIRAIEQLANLRARYAVHLAKGKVQEPERPYLEPLDMIVTSLEELEGLKSLRRSAEPENTVDEKDNEKPATKRAKWQENIERLNLLGSAAKRASQLYERAAMTAADKQRKNDSEAAKRKFQDPLPERKNYPKDQIDWLKDAADYYKKAHDEKPKKAYALTNWLSLCALISLRGARIDEEETQPPNARQQELLLDNAARSEQQADDERPDFWTLAAKGDLALTGLLIQAAARLSDTGGEEERENYERDFETLAEGYAARIAGNYKKAWNRGGSILKMNSVLEQLDFVVDALSSGRSGTNFERACLTKAVLQIEDDIKKEMSEEV